VALEVQRPGGAVQHPALGVGLAVALLEVHVPGRDVDLRLRVDVELVAGERRGSALRVLVLRAGLGRVAVVVDDDAADQRDGAALVVPFGVIGSAVAPRPRERDLVRHREVAVALVADHVGLDLVVRRLERRPRRARRRLRRGFRARRSARRRGRGRKRRRRGLRGRRG
jgi:hypothetical protein